MCFLLYNSHNSHIIRRHFQMELTIEQALKKGIEAHKAGRVQEADRYYTAIIAAQPKHPDANHNMGVLAVGIGKVETSLPFFKVALESNSNIGQFWLSYIDALIKLDRMGDAKEVLDQAKDKQEQNNIFNYETKQKFENIQKKLQKDRTPKDDMKALNDQSLTKNLNIEDPSKTEIQPLLNLYNQGQFKRALSQASK